MTICPYDIILRKHWGKVASDWIWKNEPEIWVPLYLILLLVIGLDSAYPSVAVCLCVQQCRLIAVQKEKLTKYCFALNVNNFIYI